MARDAQPLRRERKPLVFISYSHRDAEWLDKLRPFLAQLERHELLEPWVDTGIATGANWYQAIRDRMSEARAVILLVTQNFLASEFCMLEELPVFLQSARRGKLTVFPILLDNCNWQAERWLKRIQMKTWSGAPIRKAGADFTEVFTELAQELTRAVEDGYEPPGLAKAREWASAPYDLSRLPETGSLLFGRERELSLLDRAWNDARTNMVVFVAGGGVGKSTLARVWCEMLAEEDWRGATRAFAWSFYSQGTGRMSTADRFVEEAFRFLGSEVPRELSMWDRGEKLAELVRQKKTLLVLDGLEPLQSDSDADRGSVRDPALRVLLESLAEENNGLCVVTTREPLTDVASHDAVREGHMEFPDAVLHRSLDHVSLRSGRALLRVQDVTGENTELEKKVEELGQHALAIDLYARAVADTPQRHVASLDLPPLAFPPEEGGHPRRVMDAWAKQLGDGPELELLHVLGLFDRPATHAAVHTVLDGEVLPGVNRHLKRADDSSVLERLRKAGLVDRASMHQADLIDTHPLVREHFGARLLATFPKNAAEAHRRLYVFYAASAPHRPDTLEEMEPLFAAIVQGCAAGLHQEVFDGVYWERLARGDEYFVTRQLGAFAADLSMLAHFFAKRWTEPVATLTGGFQSLLLNDAGYALRALGRPREAVEPLRNALKRRVAMQKWKGAAIVAGNLSELYVALGELRKAEESADESVRLADASGDVFQRIVNRTTHADALFCLGEFERARKLFETAEDLQAVGQRRCDPLYSLPGYRYCSVLLDAAEPREVERRARRTLEWAEQAGDLLSVALDLLSLGRAELLIDPSNLATAAPHIQRAVDNLRYAGQHDYLIPGLLTRAELRRLQHDFPAAQRDLNETAKLIRRSGFQLFEADHALEEARFFHAQGHTDSARRALERASELVEAMSYGLRRPEVERLRAELGA